MSVPTNSIQSPPGPLGQPPVSHHAPTLVQQETLPRTTTDNEVSAWEKELSTLKSRKTPPLTLVEQSRVTTLEKQIAEKKTTKVLSSEQHTELTHIDAEIATLQRDFGAATADEKTHIQRRLDDLNRQAAALKARPQPTPVQKHGELVNTIQDQSSEILQLREKIAVLEKNQKAVGETTLGDSAVINQTASAGEMVVCDCRVHLDKHHDLPKTGVTPAEAVILIAQFHVQKGDMPIHAITPHTVTTAQLDDKKKAVRNPDDNTAVLANTVVKTIKRQPDQEIARLKSKYGEKKVAALFPGANPTLPATFKDALRIGMAVALPSSTLAKDQGGDKLGAIVINA